MTPLHLAAAMQNPGVVRLFEEDGVRREELRVARRVASAMGHDARLGADSAEIEARDRRGSAADGASAHLSGFPVNRRAHTQTTG
mmetsp:Transcript_71100/g.162947  ORF Transcript_71100/g.162947 Transcript_71100/m.162947 type:complete len:85 (+) Transcript_71100:730-984(+)